ncbi:MAG: sulfate adenylyltransferase subunit CysD, partial [Lentisphaeraceae bacterium]|nr:sulfate adenylyltransferase subunit CysD [Lentisphaeraceae bacterium]
ELWSLYNSRINPGESIRVFPISNWTEMDVWKYIERENIPIVPLYYAAKRPFVEKDGVLIMVDDDRMPTEGQEIKEEMIRFRTLGCYPLTGALRSTATTMPEMIDEMHLSNISERNSRVIDFDGEASMEKKKREGYF